MWHSLRWVVDYVWPAFEDNRPSREQLLVLLTGVMLGSGAAFPVFYPASLDLRYFCLWSIGFYLPSATAFAIIKRYELAKNGVIALAYVFHLAVLVLFFGPSSLEHLGPYIPIFGALAMLGTVHLVPLIKESMGTTRNLALYELGRHDCVFGTDTSSGHRSSRSNSSFQLGSPLEFGHPPWSEFETRHMGPVSSEIPRRIGSSRGSMSSNPSAENSSSLSDASITSDNPSH